MGAHHSRHLQASWNKHGEACFAFEAIDFCRPEKLLEVEQHYIDSINPSFNVCKTAGSTLGRNHSEETRAKISKRRTGSKMPPRDAEYRKKLSDIHKGKKKPDHVMKRLQEGRRNQVFGPDRLKRMSEALKNAYATGRKCRERPDAYREKIGRTLATLTDDQVRDLRRMRADGYSLDEIRCKYPLSKPTISEIARGLKYKWVT